MRIKDLRKIKRLIRQQNKKKGYRKVPEYLFKILDAAKYNLDMLSIGLNEFDSAFNKFNTLILAKNKHSCKDVQLYLQAVLEFQENIASYEKTLFDNVMQTIRCLYPEVISDENKKEMINNYEKRPKKYERKPKSATK